MVDWHSQATALAARDAFVKLLHLYLGIYVWEMLITLDFEWRVLTGKKKFKWPLTFYFLNRYVCLAALVGALVMFDADLKDCRAIFAFNLFTIHLALTLASLNLAIRTIAIWEQNRIVIASVAILATVHCCLCIYQSATSVILRVPGVGCFPTSKNYGWDTAIYIYALVFDTLAIGLNVYKLRSRLDRKSIFSASSITTIVFRQGMVYFIVALLVNIVAITFLALDFNVGTIGATTCFASTVCTIVACRAVRELSDAKGSTDTRLPQFSGSGGIKVARSTRLMSTGSFPSSSFIELKAGTQRSQVLVKTETVVKGDEFSGLDYDKNPEKDLEAQNGS